MLYFAIFATLLTVALSAALRELWHENRRLNTALLRVERPTVAAVAEASPRRELTKEEIKERNERQKIRQQHRSR